MTYTPPSLAAIEAAIGSGQVDPEDPPAETAVRVIADIGGTATPQILVAETSQTGLTASIGRNDGSRHRLPAAELFRGARIERGDHWYELYTPARYRALTESDSDARSPAATYPEPTHEPTGGTHAASEDVSRQGSGEPTHV